MIFESTRFAHWGTDLAALRNVDTDQVLWVLRMFALVLGVGACVYAVVHALGGMTASGRDREAINPALSESQGAGSQRQQLDAGTVKSWGWFSEPLESGAQLAEAPIPLEEAQELSLTKLNLRLEGIALGASPEVSLAIIEIDGKSERYTIGTKLPVGRNVYLRAIMRESVHLDNNGKLEELPLFAGDMMMPQRKVPASATSRLGLIDKSSNPLVTSTLGRYREQIQRDPNSASQLLRYEPYLENGMPVGFKIRAAGDARVFANLGLQDGDIVTHVNGVQLTDFSQSLSLYQGLNQMTDVTVQLLREGQPQDISYRLPESR